MARQRDESFRAHNSLFTEESWIAVLLGQNIIPRAADPLVAMLPVGETVQFMNHMREIVARTAEAMPTHEDYIAKHCAMARQAAQ